MAAKNWTIQDLKRKNGNTVEFWLAYKQYPASVAVVVKIVVAFDLFFASENSPLLL